jgi:hypothetical protein
MDQFGSSLSYAVDIVFCIDVTGSMEPVLEQVKQGAMGFHDQLSAAMAEKNKRISSLRIRTVAYRDFLHDQPADVMLATPFLALPAQQAEFHGAVSMLEPFGGGDEPESGLEALAFAMSSEWERGLDRRRHIIVLFTDASAHPLERAFHITGPQYGQVVPPNLDELTEMWESPDGGLMEFAAKRLLLYAPDVYPWNIVSSSWSNTLHYLSNAGEGLSDYELRQIIENIANSV